MSNKDFNKWINGKPDWRTISYDYNTGTDYQTKQDLFAVFYNSYVYIEKKAIGYYNEFKILPIEELHDLIFDFQKHFPNKNRVSGINYFDDLINLLISKYRSQEASISTQQKTDYWERDAENEITLNQFEKAVSKIIENTEKNNNLGCFPMRFRMLPRTILDNESNSYERKKYLLKRMYRFLKKNEKSSIINELLEEFLLIVEPYSDIFSFIITELESSHQEQSEQINLSKSTKIHKSLSFTLFFKVSNIKNEYDKEYGRNIDKDYPILLDINNWQEYSEQFFIERKAKYQTNDEFIAFESEWLKQLLESVDKLKTSAERVKYRFLIERYSGLLKSVPPLQSKKPKPELTINQIALKYVYSNIQITRENGNEIAKVYGHNSGEKLFQRFTFYSSSANRKGKPNLCTPKKLNNKIKLIESVVELLPPGKQERAKDEVLILKKIYEAEYQ